MNNKDTIKRHMETIRELEQSDDNKRRKALWKDAQYRVGNHWRGLPRTDGSCLKGQVPVHTDPNNAFWAKYLNLSLKDFYLNGETFLENYLKITIERFKLFKDDAYIVKRIPMWMSVAYEATFFGMKVNFFDDIEPWLDYEEIIKKPEDLKKMKFPNFYKSGLMPKAIEVYEYVKENIDDDFEVLFPMWARGPFGLAVYLRGFNNLMMDMIDRPQFMHELMRFITDSMKSWFDSLAQYLGKPVGKGTLFNDEVNCPSLSPEFYKEFVLPYEKELCEYHGGLHYWHSCGDITRLCRLIREIPNIDLIHRGPWTNAQEIGKVFGDTSAIEVCFNTEAEIMGASDQEIRKLLTGIIKDFNETNVKGYCLRADNITFYKSWEDTFSKANEFYRIAKDVISSLTM